MPKNSRVDSSAEDYAGSRHSLRLRARHTVQVGDDLQATSELCLALCCRKAPSELKLNAPKDRTLTLAAWAPEVEEVDRRRLVSLE